MLSLPNPVIFEWDKGNKEKNFDKHNVTSDECEETLMSQPNLVVKDTAHSTLEERMLVLGVTHRRRHLTVIFTIREDKVRVISARDMNKRERKIYEEKTES